MYDPHIRSGLTLQIESDDPNLMSIVIDLKLYNFRDQNHFFSFEYNIAYYNIIRDAYLREWINSKPDYAGFTKIERSVRLKVVRDLQRRITNCRHRYPQLCSGPYDEALRQLNNWCKQHQRNLNPPPPKTVGVAQERLLPDWIKGVFIFDTNHQMRSMKYFGNFINRLTLRGYQYHVVEDMQVMFLQPGETPPPRSGDRLIKFVVCLNPSDNFDMRVHFQNVPFADDWPMTHISCFGELPPEYRKPELL